MGQLKRIRGAPCLGSLPRPRGQGTSNAKLWDWSRRRSRTGPAASAR